MNSDSGTAMKRDNEFETNIQHRFKKHNDEFVMEVKGSKKLLRHQNF